MAECEDMLGTGMVYDIAGLLQGWLQKSNKSWQEETSGEGAASLRRDEMVDLLKFLTSLGKKSP